MKSWLLGWLPSKAQSNLLSYIDQVKCLNFTYRKFSYDYIYPSGNNRGTDKNVWVDLPTRGHEKKSCSTVNTNEREISTAHKKTETLKIIFLLSNSEMMSLSCL